MQIREATIDDAENIKNVYLRAFGKSEARLVSDVAVDLLNEDHPVKIISLVAIENNEIVGHIAFSPVFFESTNEHFGYILAPLAVSPEFQKNKIGSSLVKYGLDIISNTGSFIVFVYGDPQYYSRFGFKTDPAKNFIPQYTLQFPEGWQALKLNSAVFPGGGAIACVDSLNNPDLW
ncbi:MAG: N-acetyltransferase [Elusimicrobiota bacterium]|nr:N-acetyltransferase [Elusimicrobiota bacterium]